MDHTEQKRDPEPFDLDDILPQVGEFGRYQKLLLWLVCLPACIPCGFCAFNQLFMNATPDHWCKTPELANFSAETRRQLSIPKLNDSYSKCRRYSINWTEFQDYDCPNTSWPLEDCLQGWEFDENTTISSIVTYFELVCEKDIYPTLGLVALNLGGPVGVFYFGILNDRIGRKKTFFACLSTLIVGNILSLTAQNFWWWAFARMVVGFTIPAIYQIPFIISLELVGRNYRSFVTVMICLFYTFGLMVLAGIAYLVRDWWYLNLVTSVPFVFYYFYWFFLPESPRWLLAKGHFEEASKILETLAKVNCKELPVSFKQQLKQRMLGRTASEEEAAKQSPSCVQLCATPNMRLKTLLITLNWFANETVYVGLSYYGPSLGSNEYISFFLSSAVEIPSCLVCWLVMDRWGRRWPLALCMIISGICCMATVLLPSDAVGLILVFFLISKSTIAASFLIIYPFAGELFPTQLRGIGIGTSAYIAGMGLIIIPFITYLGSEMLVLPLLIMGALSVIGGLTGLRLPETLHHRLPQTLEEGEEFGKDFTRQDCLRCIPLRPQSMNCSYEDLELEPMKEEANEDTPLGRTMSKQLSIRKLVRQASVMDTPKDADGAMKMTYWF